LKILMVYPQYPDTFWSFRYALKFIAKKAANPPLGLLTVAAMLPGEWEKKLVDMNVSNLTDDDISWADYVFLSAMAVQQDSVREVIARCNKLCPFNCEFCDIIVLNGHKPRTKDKEQVLAELDALYRLGWRAGVFIVDDNFIGNRRKLKSEILPAVIEWMKTRKYPFALSTEASINMADDEELMQLMTEAGFDTVFVGIETPNEESLVECNKSQNQNRDLVASVNKIQNHGFVVQGGFIVGFDSDPLSIFKSQISFTLFPSLRVKSASSRRAALLPQWSVC